MRHLRYWICVGSLLLFACGRGTSSPEGNTAKSPEAAVPSVKPQSNEPIVRGTELQQAVNLEPDFLYGIEPPNGTATGGITPARLRISPNADRQFEVAIVEDCIDCAGTMWQSSVRTAAALSAASLGRSLFDYEFKIAVRGRVDGPSAGALLAATFMAVMMGDNPKQIHERLQKVAMTGGLNPDGTIAPVGLLHQKLDAALRANKEVFCFPHGQNRAWNPNSKQREPLDDACRQRHVKSREIADIYDAYECLMDKRFPDQPAVEPKEMDYNFEGMRQVALRWLDAAAKSEEEARKFPLMGFMLDSVKDATAAAKRASEHLQQPATVPLGYLEAQEASSRFAVVRLIGALLGACADRKLAPAKRDEIISQLVKPALDMPQAWDGFYQRLVAGQPRSVDDAINLVQAHSWAARSRIAMQHASEALKQFQAPKRKLSELCQPQAFPGLLMHLLHSAEARNFLDAGADVTRVDEKRGESLKVDVNKLDALAQLHWSLADANWEMYKALVPSHSKSLAVTQTWELIEYGFKKRQEKTTQSMLASLGATMQANLDLSRMITADYTLRSDDPNKSESYTEMLERAEGKAREAAHVAHALTGMVPLPARFHYMQAMHVRDSIQATASTAPKLQALQAFWTSAAMSELTRQLAQLQRAPSGSPSTGAAGH